MKTISEIISTLETRRGQIDRALEALANVENGDQQEQSVAATRLVGMSEETRRKMSLAMKRRWRVARRAGQTRIG